MRIRRLSLYIVKERSKALHLMEIKSRERTAKQFSTLSDNHDFLCGIKFPAL
jgi:hypothetical protein